MLIRNAKAEWQGDLLNGSGQLSVGSGALDVPYSVKSRLEDGQSATNPEEQLGASHAGCFTMALAADLSRAGFTPTHLQTGASVAFEKIGEAFAVTRIELETSADIPGIDDATFQKHADDAKENCPVSKALSEARARSFAAVSQRRRVGLFFPRRARQTHPARFECSSHCPCPPDTLSRSGD